MDTMGFVPPVAGTTKETQSPETDQAGIALEVIARMEDYGDWRTLATWSDKLVPLMAEQASPGQHLEFAAHRQRLAVALAYESVHGPGSLLVADHPRYVALRAMVGRIHAARVRDA